MVSVQKYTKIPIRPTISDIMMTPKQPGQNYLSR